MPHALPVNGKVSLSTRQCTVFPFSCLVAISHTPEWCFRPATTIRILSRTLPTHTPYLCYVYTRLFSQSNDNKYGKAAYVDDFLHLNLIYIQYSFEHSCILTHVHRSILSRQYMRGTVSQLEMLGSLVLSHLWASLQYSVPTVWPYMCPSTYVAQRRPCECREQVSHRSRPTQYIISVGCISHHPILSV